MFLWQSNFENLFFQKRKFYTINLLENADLNKIDIYKTVVSNKVSFSKSSFRSFIDYRDAKTIRPLCIFLIKMSTYRKDW